MVPNPLAGTGDPQWLVAFSEIPPLEFALEAGGAVPQLASKAAPVATTASRRTPLLIGPARGSITSAAPGNEFIRIPWTPSSRTLASCSGNASLHCRRDDT